MRWFADREAQEAAKMIDGVGARLQPLAKKLGRQIDRGKMSKDAVLAKYDARLRPMFELTLYEMGRITRACPERVSVEEISAFADDMRRRHPDVNFRFPEVRERDALVVSPSEGYGRLELSLEGHGPAGGGGESAVAVVLSFLAAVAAFR